MKVIYKNSLIRVEVEKSEVPWFKIKLQEPYGALAGAKKEVKSEVLRVLDRINQEMINFYQPDKINIVSVGHAFPHIYWHIVARFRADSHFPELMWGEKQREGEYKLEQFNEFLQTLKEKLS